jgi:putative ABC transport system ATP-binding protein
MIELTEVSRSYPGGVVALDRVTTRLERGELTAVVGPSGSGKSTMLNILGTLDRPTSGTVRIDGHDVAGLSDRQLSALRARRIGFVFQQFHLAPGRTAVANVADGLLYAGVPRKERERRAEAALHRVGLGERLGHRPHQLSGGERQRVAVARAVAGDPALLLADEPTGDLDEHTADTLHALLREMHKERGLTSLIATHNPRLAAACDRVLRLADGRLTPA